MPPALVDQLAEGGRLLIPVGPPGEGPQELLRLRKVDGRARREALIPVRFVPLL